VLVLGRLSLFGQGAARLHDELITVMADWKHGSDRQAALQPWGQEQQPRIWPLLQQALTEAGRPGRILVDRNHLQAGAAADVEALLPALEQAANAALERATALLKARGQGEADSLKEVLRSQRTRIQATLKQRTRDLAKLDRQLAQTSDATPLITGLEEQIDIPELDLARLTSQERRQLAADQKHWQRRLETIKAELESEPKRIQASYRVVTHRLEPAGLVYLWPTSG
jgi:hypothetical protein